MLAPVIFSFSLLSTNIYADDVNDFGYSTLKQYLSLIGKYTFLKIQTADKEEEENRQTRESRCE